MVFNEIKPISTLTQSTRSLRRNKPIYITESKLPNKQINIADQKAYLALHIAYFYAVQGAKMLRNLSHAETQH